jgi:hypothetical protein
MFVLFFNQDIEKLLNQSSQGLEPPILTKIIFNLWNCLRAMSFNSSNEFHQLDSQLITIFNQFPKTQILTILNRNFLNMESNCNEKIVRSLTNNVLVSTKSSQTTFYVPAYLRLVFKKLSRINL